MIYNEKKTILEYIKNYSISDGYHTLQTNANNELVDIDVEIINFQEDISYTTSPILGNDVSDTRMLILIYHNNLTINSNVIITPQTRKKGMLIYCKKTLLNNGTISMSARGAMAEGQNIFLYKNADNTFEYIPSVGGLGASSVYTNSTSPTNVANGLKGKDGDNRGTGGGGSGGANTWNGARGYSGSGSNGTSYSGGSGGGGLAFSNTSTTTRYAGNGGANGGAGGSGLCNRQQTSWIPRNAGGGAGNNGGTACSSGATATQGEDGTGGLLIIFSNRLINNGRIESNGSNGGHVNGQSGGCGGGGSGGGSVNIFYHSTIDGIENCFSNGGNGGAIRGGDGGNGSITITRTGISKLFFSSKKHFYGLNEFVSHNNELALIQFPINSIDNFIRYNGENIININQIIKKKLYVLQDTVSENEEGLWTTQLDRKPLNLSFEERK